MSYANDWYVATNGEPDGPVSFEDLIAEARDGRLTPQSFVWTTGMPHWAAAKDVAGLFPPNPVAVEGVAERNSAARPSSGGKLISRPTSVEEAHEAIGRGALAGYVFAGMYVLGGALSYVTGYDIAWRTAVKAEDAFSTFIGFMIVAAAIAALSYRFKEKGSLAIVTILGVWFAGEIAFKLVNTPFQPGWFVLYAFVAAGFVSGVRGALFLRRARRGQEAKAANVTPENAVPAMYPAAASQRKPNFVFRHWRGDLALPVSYWLFGVVFNVLLVLIGMAVGEGLARADFSPTGVGLALTAFLSFLLLVMIWQLVGIWRSAGRHNKKTGRAVWGTLARVTVVLGVLQFASQFQTFGPSLYHSMELAFGKDDTPHYELRLLRAGTEVELAGGMSTGTADALKSILDAAPAIKVIHLNSVGGWLSEGYKLNKLFRERKLATYTSAECVSACTIAFLGGASRYLSPQGKLGFHSSSFGSLGGEALPELNDDMIATLRQQGAPQWFIQKAFSTPPSSMWYPTAKELLENGIVTQVVDANQFALSGVGSIWKDSDAVRASLEDIMKENPLWSVLKTSEPAVRAKMLETATRGITEGRSMLEVQHEIYQAMSAEMLPKYLKAGRDAELVAYWKVQIDEIWHLRKQNPKACVGFLFPELRDSNWDPTKLLSDDLQKSNTDALARLVLAGTNDELPESAYAPSAEEFAGIIERGTQTEPNLASVIGNPKNFADQPVVLCGAIGTYYSQILKLRPDRAAAMFRYIARME